MSYVSFVTDLREVFDYCFSICTHFNWTLICKKQFFFLKTRTREHYFVNIIWGNFGWKLNSSLFSLDILSLDLVQVIKLLSSFIYFTVSRLSYWLLISNPVHNASRQYLFNLAKTLSLVPHKKKNAKWKSPSTRRLEVKQLRIKNKSELPAGE